VPVVAQLLARPVECDDHGGRGSNEPHDGRQEREEQLSALQIVWNGRECDTAPRKRRTSTQALDELHLAVAQKRALVVELCSARGWQLDDPTALPSESNGPRAVPAYEQQRCGAPRADSANRRDQATVQRRCFLFYLPSLKAQRHLG